MRYCTLEPEALSLLLFYVVHHVVFLHVHSLALTHSKLVGCRSSGLPWKSLGEGAFSKVLPLPLGNPFGEVPPSTWVGLASAGLLKKGVLPVSAEWTTSTLVPVRNLASQGIRARVLFLHRRTMCKPCALFYVLNFLCTWCLVLNMLTTQQSLKKGKEN